MHLDVDLGTNSVTEEYSELFGRRKRKKASGLKGKEFRQSEKARRIEKKSGGIMSIPGATRMGRRKSGRGQMRKKAFTVSDDGFAIPRDAIS